MLAKRKRVSAALLRGLRPTRVTRNAGGSVKFFDSPSSLGRCAVIISKSVSRSSVHRNALRRTIYEWIRIHEPIRSTENALVIPTTALRSMNREEFEKTLTQLFS